MQASTKYDASSIPAKCQRNIITLDGNTIEFSKNSGTIADNLLVLHNDQYADVSAKQLGDFGASDFSIELTYTGKGSDSTPDGVYGTLFVRSGQPGFPYTGPSAFLFDDGKIVFRSVMQTLGTCHVSWLSVLHYGMTTPRLTPFPDSAFHFAFHCYLSPTSLTSYDSLRYDDALECPGAFPDNAAAVPTRLAFSRKGQKLAITVGGKVVCSRTMTKSADANLFSSAPLRFGANHVKVGFQNLDVKLGNIILSRNAKTIKPGLITLNGHPTAFSLNSGKVASDGKKLILNNNQRAEISSAAVGGFGASDFSIQFTYAGLGSDATPDGPYGALFIRSSQFESPYTGPTAFVYDSGKIRFRCEVVQCTPCLLLCAHRFFVGSFAMSI